MAELKGKVAIITGASRGIGRAIALRLAHDGADLVLTARDIAALEATSALCRDAGVETRVVAADLREPDAPALVVDRAVAELGRLDIVVNNAGATKRGEFLHLTDQDWLDGFALKFFGAVRLCRAAWPHLQNYAGSIVFIAGVGGRTPGPQFAIGGSVNAALLSLTKALADAGIADGIQVNAVNPGSVRTDRLENRIRILAKESGLDPLAAAQRLQEESKITRFGEPVEVAHLVAFLVSGQGRWMQGALIDMDGGQTKTI